MSKIYRIANRFLAEFSDDGYYADVELFREGAWKHSAAPGGWFRVNKERIQNFINNFNRKICGPEIPLEFAHVPDSAKTPGFAVQFYEKVKDGISSLWAKMKFTDKTTAQRAKDGSIKWVSPTVVSDYEDTASGQLFEVIRSITLTNYPHIKNLHPIVVNFEEVINQEENMKTADEIRKQNELMLRNLEDITLEDLSENVDIAYLSEKQIEDLVEHFEMTPEQFAEKYPEAGKKNEGYGIRPKISAPKGLKKEDREKFFQAFNKLYEKYKDVEKAKTAAMKKFNLEEDPDAPKGVKEFVDKFVSAFKHGFGIKDSEVELDEDVDPKVKVKLEEQQIVINELRAFKDKAEFAEDKTLVDSYKNLTPAAKNILTTLLNVGRKSELEFEETRISVHDLVKIFLQEAAKSPSVNLFEIKSNPQDTDLDLEDEGKRRDARAKEKIKANVNLTYRQALDEVMLEESQGGK